MTEIQNSKQYDLEDRTFNFSRKVNGYVNKLPKNISNIENGKQLVRAAGLVGADYIEANESLSKKDFVMRIKICRKEAKESRYWLRLSQPHEDSEGERNFFNKRGNRVDENFWFNFREIKVKFLSF